MSGPSVAARSAVAVFDFDGTLVPGDSLLPFLAHLVGGPTLARAMGRRGPAIAGAYRRDGRNGAKAAVLAATVTGVPAAAAEAAGERFALRLLDRVRPEMARAVAAHRAQGHRLVLLSASLCVYLEPFAAATGFTDVLATRLAVRPDGTLSGALEGANVRGPEKARRLRELLGDAPAEVWAYGDSAGDTELLGMADHPVWVGRRGKRGWRNHLPPVDPRN